VVGASYRGGMSQPEPLPTPSLHVAARASQPARRAEAAPIRVVLADDHDLVRRSLRLLLESEGDVDVVAEASDLFSATRHVGGHLPDVLLLDLGMQNDSRIDLIRRLRAQVPQTQIVVISMEDSPVFAAHALRAGAVGYVLKENAVSELAGAVRLAAQGRRYVSPAVDARLQGLTGAVEGDGLTERETEVLRLTAHGLTSAEIGARLHLSPRTIETQRRHIHTKLGLGRRADLVAYALAHHLMGDLTAD